jgi:UDP-glucuronate 4-epimerase
MKILITGCAGFIGFHLSKFLLIKKNYQIVGIDNINNYYGKRSKTYTITVLYII